jgi:predicted nucleic acid-binding protein
MSRVIVDNNVFNYWLKDEPEWQSFRSILLSNNLYDMNKWLLCFPVAQELWMFSLRSGARFRDQILDTLNRCLLLPISLRICMKASEIANLYARSEKKWHDIWIAATAIELNFPLLTNNVSDFQRIIDAGFPIRILTA